MAAANMSEDREAILQLVGHDHSRTFRNTWGSWQDLLQGVAGSIRADLSGVVTGSLGSLDTLPVELLDQILELLDISSIFRFRHVNRRARQAVHELCGYQLLVKPPASDMLQALLHVGTICEINLNDFHRAILTTTCECCKCHYGHLMHLSTWTRYCTRCLRRRKDLHRGFTDILLALKEGTALIAGEIPGSDSLSWDGLDLTAPRRRITASYINSESKYSAGRTYVLLGICVMPSYDRLSGRFRRGVSCMGCTRDPTYPTTRVYTEEGFLEHFEHCREAQLLWESIAEEERKIDESNADT